MSPARWAIGIPPVLGIIFCGHLAAQVDVHVIDAITNKPLPGAIVAWQEIGGSERYVRTTDIQGHASLPADAGSVLRISFTGYVELNDTIRSLGPCVCLLHRDRITLDEFVVTAQYAPVAADRAVHKVRVIDRERLQRLSANDLGEALRYEPNIRLAQDNFLGASMTLRGLGGENVKVLIDGVPVIGRQNGNIDLSQIDLNGIDRIEIVEGPLSVTYGTNALAGTVNLITRKNAGPEPSLTLSAHAESIGRLDLHAQAGKRWGHHDLVINAGRDFFTGWDPSRSGLPALGASTADSTRHQEWKPREQYNARINYHWHGSLWTLGLKSEYGNDLITDRGSPRAPYRETAFDQTFRTVRFDNAATAERNWTRGKRFNLLIAHDRYVRTRTTWLRDLTSLDAQLATSIGMQDTSRFTLTACRAVLTNANDSARIRFEIGTDLNYETGRGERIGHGMGAIGDYAIFSSIEYTPTRSVVLRPALRYAYNTSYTAPLLPSFNVRWQLDANLVARASYARGFRAPGLKELYLDFVDVNHDISGNTALKAERSHSIAASLTWTHGMKNGMLRTDLSGFFDRVEDLITLANISGNSYTYVNAGNVRTTGGSAGIAWRDRSWGIDISCSAMSRSDGIARGKSGAFLWSGEGRVGVSRDLRHAWSAQVFYRYQGETQGYAYQTGGTVGRTSLNAIQFADASVTKRFWHERMRAAFGCKNLFDVRNVMATGGSGVHGSTDGPVPMMTGRNFFIELALTLNESNK